MYERGLKIAFESKNFTETHQIWLKVDEKEGTIDPRLSFKNCC